MKRGTLLKRMDELERRVAKCRACPLSLTRRKTVFGAGNPEADLVVVGEGPGEEEDIRGVPFVGRAGRLLERMLETIGRSRANAYIMNVVKCRACSEPSEEDIRKAPAFWRNRLKNRPPAEEEIEACSGFFREQMELLPNRKLILAFGGTAGNVLLGVRGEELRVAKMRGRVYRTEFGPVVATYHPSYLLRSPAEKVKSYRDLLLAKSFLDASEKDRSLMLRSSSEARRALDEEDGFRNEPEYRPGLLDFQKDVDSRRITVLE